MNNSFNSSLIKTNIITLQNSYNLYLKDTLPHINNNNESVIVNTYLDQGLLNKNITNISQGIEITTTTLNEEKNFTINPTINLIGAKNQSENKKEVIPITTTASQFTYIKKINNTLIISENEKQSVSNNNNTNHKNMETEIINNENNINMTKMNDPIIKTYLGEYNNTNNTESKSFLPKNITIPLINKTYDTKYVLGFGIFLPVIIIAILIILICYCIKKKKKLKMNLMSNNYDINRIKFQNSGVKQPYNKLQNTSGINVNMNANNMSMSEIKVQNLKDEIHNIITNSSGGSNSSGRRKREKKRSGNKNNKNSNSVSSGLDKNKPNQYNNNNEQIKQ
jgi:hypothetical protein